MERFISRHPAAAEREREWGLFRLRVLSRDDSAVEVDSGLLDRNGTPVPALLSGGRLVVREAHGSCSTQFVLSGAPASAVLGLGSRVAAPDLSGDGREAEPHVTLLHGITDGAALAKAQGLTALFAPPRAEFSGVGVFEGADYDVLVLLVRSPELMEIRRTLEGMVENVQTYPDYNPHATIAYLRKGKADRYSGLPVPRMRFRLDSLVFSRKGGEKVRIPLLGVSKPGSIFLSGK